MAPAANFQIHKRSSRALAKRLRSKARLQKSSCLLILPEALMFTKAYSNMSTILRCRLERLMLIKAMLSTDHWTIWNYMCILLMDSILKTAKLMLSLLDCLYYSSAKLSSARSRTTLSLLYLITSTLKLLFLLNQIWFKTHSSSTRLSYSSTILLRPAISVSSNLRNTSTV